MDLLESRPHHGVLLHGLRQRLPQPGDQRDVAPRTGASAATKGRALARVDLQRIAVN